VASSRYGRTQPEPSRLGRLPGVGAITKVADRESGVQRFYRDTRSELRKVVWPTREQAINLTVLVIVASVAVGVILGGADLLFAQLFKMLVGQG
jgi:preprotein translocase subunit SecE